MLNTLRKLKLTKRVKVRSPHGYIIEKWPRSNRYWLIHAENCGDKINIAHDILIRTRKKKKRLRATLVALTFLL